MKQDRFNALMDDATLSLTRAECEDGWHFCPDWDGMLKQFDEICPCDKWTADELNEIGEKAA